MQAPRLPVPFDFRAPDYRAVFAHRLGVLQRLRAGTKQQQAERLRMLFLFYRDNPIQFVIDWGCTFDPRNALRGLPATMPFMMFPRQIEWMQFILDCMSVGADGLTEKSRDVGASWLAVSLSAALCMFRDGFVIGFGSRKEEYVDKLGAPKSLFYKLRMFLRLLPPEFRRGWEEKQHGPHMRIMFPTTGAVIAGEAGDNIGRGDRTAVHFVDEAAHLERPELVEASLSATTNCRQDMSSVNGSDNPFAVKAAQGVTWTPGMDLSALTRGTILKFTFHWRQDPRKDDDWYNAQVAKLPAVVVAQEIDISYTASKTGIVIPQEWVQAAIDAHEALGFDNTGERTGALDIADEGIDLNAFASKRGVVVDYVEAWSGKGSDIFGTVERAFTICDAEGLRSFRYDSDGLGAGARGDARVLNEQRGARPIDAQPWRGSGSVANEDDPIPTAVADGRDGDERTNKDFFKNAKSQGWWELRVRFQRTFRARHEGHSYPPEELISLSSHIPCLAELCMQLSQPTYSKNGAGQILIDKQPEGAKSPNHADALMILCAPSERRPRSFFD